MRITIDLDINENIHKHGSDSVQNVTCHLSETLGLL